MFKFSTILIITLLFSFSLYAQDTARIIAKYKILKSIHGNDILSKFDQDRQGYLLFHYDKLKQINLTNMSYESGSYSTGRLQILSKTVKEDSTLTTIYKWNFRNSYNKEKGIMTLMLTEKKTKYGTEFTFKGISKDKSTLEYSGYKETDLPNYVIPEAFFR